MHHLKVRGQYTCLYDESCFPEEHFLSDFQTSPVCLLDKSSVMVKALCY